MIPQYRTLKLKLPKYRMKKAQYRNTVKSHVRPPPPLIRQSHCHQRSRHRIQSAGLLQSNSSCYNFSQKIENNMKENHSSWWIKHPILTRFFSQIIIIKNPGLRQLPKSHFPRNRKVISQFPAGIKQAIHGSQRYPLTPSILVDWKRKGPRTTSDVWESG